MRTICSLGNMFSRNRFNGQHGAGVPPKGGAKSKVHPPKKRAPNPKVALVIRGKIHRLLQGSVDHHVPESHLYYAGIEEEEEREAHESRKEHRSAHPKVRSRADEFAPNVSSIKRHGVASGPPCVGEVELNREGCIRIPCTLQHKSCRPPNMKRISFESGLRDPPEQMRPLSHYGPISPDMNGTKFSSATRREFASPRIRQKRPYSTGDCVDYNFNRALPDTLLEEDEDKEEASSAIIEHILKELRGINKIQEEISDLRDYLTSVRGSVEEVSSCVDAVLLEIEGIRSSSKGSSGTHAGTWSGTGCNDGSSPRRRPASAYGSLGSAVPKSDSSCFAPVCNQRHTIHGEMLLPRTEESTVSPITESVDNQELEEPDDTSDHSSDIPEGAVAGKLTFSYLEQIDGQECLSTSSLSSGHSSKSESDSERPSSSHGREQHRTGDMKEHWTDSVPPHSAAREPAWNRGAAFLREQDLGGHDDETALCGEEAESWDHYRGAGGYGASLPRSTGSSEPLSSHSGKHYNSPASTSSREEWQSQMRRPQSQSRIHDPPSTSFGNATVGYECAADLSYPQSSGYHSVEGRNGEDLDSQQTNDLSYINCEIETYLAYEESPAVTWSGAPSSTTEGSADRSFTQQSEVSYQSTGARLPHPGDAEGQVGGFNVKRIGRAVLDFSSALRGALRKLEVPGAVNPEEETDFEIPTLSDPLATEMPSQFSYYEPPVEQTSEGTQGGDPVDTGKAFGELTATSTANKSNNFFVEPVLEETNSLILDTSEASQDHLSFEKIPLQNENLEEHTAQPEPVLSNMVVSEKPADFPVEEPSDVGIKAQLSQCTTGESLSTSILADESAGPEEQKWTEVPLQPTTDGAAAPEDKPEGEPAEPSTEMSQMDERRLKCLRSFQQILQEKRETRRNLASMTMYTLSQDVFEPGSLGMI